MVADLYKLSMWDQMLQYTVATGKIKAVYHQ